MYEKTPVYLVQVNYKAQFENTTNYWLPYSVGVLWSYASQFDIVNENFLLEKIIYKRETILDLAKSIKPNSVIAFSNYIWNFEYNKLLAKTIKDICPNTFVVFGGPQVTNKPIENQFFKHNPYVDSVIIGEGEKSFLDLLTDFKNNALKKIYKSTRVEDLNFPSPYLTGVFDQIMAEESDVLWNAVLETNRGCPYQCTFCDWGSLTYSKVKKFDQERVFAEIEWLSKHKIDYLMFADANFGIFKERDYAIAQKLCQEKKTNGYPTNVGILYNKNSTKDVVSIIKLLAESSITKGMTVSFQSMNETVLESIKRKNMDLNKAKEIFEYLDQEGLAHYSELILGLPNETYQTWSDGLFQLIEFGQHQCIDTFFTSLLENSELNDPEQRAKYGIRFTKILSSLVFSVDTQESIPHEHAYIVRSTNSMSQDDLIKGWMLYWVINNFHCQGWTQIYSRFLRNHSNISYEAFYSRLFEAIKSGEIIFLSRLYNQALDNVLVYLDDNLRFIEENRTSNISHDVQNDLYKNKKELELLIKNFVSDNFDIDSKILDNLFEYQKHFKTNSEKSYPYQANLDHGIKKTIIDNIPYSYSMQSCTVNINHDLKNEQDFLSKIFARRRDGYGKTFINF
jgi:hypothetical protein